MRARHILDHWVESRARFIKVFPHEYAKALKQMNATVATDAAVSKAKGKTAAVTAK